MLLFTLLPIEHMKHLSAVVALFFGVFVITSFVTPSFAQTGCTQVFGGGTPCKTSTKIGLAKQVKHPQTNQFVKVLPTTGPYFTEDQPITFRITVENKTNSKLNKIIITDTLPKYFSYSLGEGKFDKKKNSLTITLDSLDAKARKTYDISGKIASSPEISRLTNGSNCFINQVSAVSGRETAQTNTHYCLQASEETASFSSPTPSKTQNGTVVYAPQTVTQSPDTGAETFGLIALLPAAYAGFLLRKRSR